MGWVRNEDTMPDHLKIVGLSDAAFRLWISAQCYSSRANSNGLVPTPTLMRMTESASKKVVAELAGARLLDARPDGGYEVHDYLVYNPSAAEVKDRREQAAERQRKARARTASQRDAGPAVTRDSHVTSQAPVTAKSLAGAVAPAGLGAEEQPPVVGVTTTIDAGASELDRAVQILGTCHRWPFVEPMLVMNAATMYPLVSIEQAARLAVVWASEPSWEMDSLGATLRAALRKLDEERTVAAAKAPRTDGLFDGREIGTAKGRAQMERQARRAKVMNGETP